MLSVEEKLRLALVLLFVFVIVAGEVGVLVVWVKERWGGNVRGIWFAHPLVRKVFTFLFLVLFFFFLYAWIVEPIWIEVDWVRLDTPKLRKGSKVRIVQLSDIHCRGWHRNEKRIPSMVNALNPDIICLTGDYMNDIRAWDAVRRMVGELRAKWGIFAVRGNWDTDLFPDLEIFKGLPVKMLNGEGVRIRVDGGEIYVAGLDVYNESALDKALSGRKMGDFIILLYHYPDLIEDIRGKGIDLYLAGHIHGGQIALPFYGAIITLSRYGKRYERGLYKVGETYLYVNRGIGTETLPLRFFSRPEIAVVELNGVGE